jgi:(2Fe-2S) ferredoxin
VRQTIVEQVGLVVCQECPGGAADLLSRHCAADAAVAQIRTTRCLDRCDFADVLVVRPAPEGRRRGGRPVWFGFTGQHALSRLQEWVAAGGPGLADMPDDLARYEISRPRAGS